VIKTYIKRPLYLQSIRPFINKDIIKVLVGQRRVGKSYLLFNLNVIARGLLKKDSGQARMTKKNEMNLHSYAKSLVSY